MSAKKLTLTALFVALAVIGSTFSFPILTSRCAPIQHTINILGAIFLGPVGTLLAAFLASCIRYALSLGTLLAFPGSLCGALLASFLYARYHQKWAAMLGELLGTGVIGALLAGFLAIQYLGTSPEVGYWAFSLPFFISSLGGVIFSAILLFAIEKPLQQYLKN